MIQLFDVLVIPCNNLKTSAFFFTEGARGVDSTWQRWQGMSQEVDPETEVPWDALSGRYQVLVPRKLEVSRYNIVSVKISFQGLYQEWATLLGSRTTLETYLVYVGQYEYLMYLFDSTFERKWALISPISKEKYFIEVLMFFQPKNVGKPHYGA
jgi:hypothetical protein